MILREVVFLRKSIARDRLIMYEKAKGKNLFHTDVLKISQQLDKKINKMQKILSEINIH